MDVEKNVTRIAEKMDVTFWEQWSEETIHFPDNEDGWDLQLLIVQVALATIVSKYLLGFRSSRRCEELERLIVDLRTIEASIRDID